MKIMSCSHLFYFILILLLISCEFEPDSTYNNTISDITAPDIEVVELNLDNENDTIYLYTKKDIEFKFNVTPQLIYGVELIIDGESQETVQNEEGEFDNISWYDLDEGTHSLIMNIYTSSGTGSIADQLGTEVYTISKEWVLYVDKTFYDLTKETSVNGVFSMEWPVCKSYDFEEFIIYKKFGNGNMEEVCRQTTTSFIDSTYAGEDCNYLIKAVTSDKTISWGSLEMSDNIPSIIFEIKEDNTYWLRFLKPTYYAGVDSILLVEESGYSSYSWDISSINLMDTISQQIDGVFAEDVSYSLKLVPKDGNIGYDSYYFYYTQKYSFQLGFPVDPNSFWLDDVHQVAADEFVFFGYNDTLKRFSTASMSITEQISLPIIDGCSSSRITNVEYSATGKTMTTDIGCSLDMDIAYMNTNDFSIDEIPNLQYLTGTTYHPSIPISDVGIGVVESELTKNFYLYDFLSSKVVGETYYHSYSIRINPTAEYLYIHGGTNLIVSFKDGVFTTLVEIDAFDSDFKHFEFHPFETNQAVVWYGDDLLFKDCETYATINSYSLEGETLYDIDYYNGKVLTWISKKLVVRKLSDGTILQEIPVDFSPNIQRTDCKIIGNCIVYDDGVICFCN